MISVAGLHDSEHEIIMKRRREKANQAKALQDGRKTNYGSIQNTELDPLMAPRMATRSQTMPPANETRPTRPISEPFGVVRQATMPDDASDTSEDDTSEGEEEYLDLNDPQLQHQAAWLLFCGTAIVIVFAEAMCDVITNMAKAINVDPFYVSFVVTPMASNGAEVLAALMFAQKRTTEGISLTYSSLYGAACMNNTFCLAIFCILIYVQELPWNYWAETVTILFVILTVGYFGRKKTIVMWEAGIIGSLFPLSLVMVIELKKAFAES